MSVQAKATASAALLVMLLAASAPEAAAQPLTIYQIQSNTVNGDASIYDGQVVDCVGGICVAKYAGSRPRLILQDPNYPDGWGAIQVKDWISPFQMFNEVEIGDWVEFTNMLVEEFRGTTLLQRQAAHNPGYNIVSRNNPLPPPLVVCVCEIPAPLYDPITQGWYVKNHDAEPYESMRIIVRDLTVTEMNLGKAVDNYNLQKPGGDDCWATDYMNENVGPWGYHPFVQVGQNFCTVGGVFEQYTQLTSGWDYYQLATMRTADLGICGDLNCDGEVTFADIDPFVLALSGPSAYYSQYPDCNWLSADCNGDGSVAFDDIDPFVALLGGG